MRGSKKPLKKRLKRNKANSMDSENRMPTGGHLANIALFAIASNIA
jgi:hypothetical protein